MRTRATEYASVKSKARSWLDRLEVDPVDLVQRGIKGKKKLAEIVDAYSSLIAYARDPGDRAAIRRRLDGLAEQSRRPEYHDMATVSYVQFAGDSMSYLRVAWLLRKLGYETAAYEREIRAIQPRLDGHLARRGPWQQAMFAEYYERLGLQWPAGFVRSPLRQGIIAERRDVASLDRDAVYDLTHEIFVAFDYGDSREQAILSEGDLAYSRRVLPELIRVYMTADDPDLVAELVSCMTYLGWHGDPAHAAGVDYLLDGQNIDGSWGHYEAYRATFGPYLDQHAYLHTTLVVMQALVESFEGKWRRAEDAEDGGANERSSSMPRSADGRTAIRAAGGRG